MNQHTVVEPDNASTAGRCDVMVYPDEPCNAPAWDTDEEGYEYCFSHYYLEKVDHGVDLRKKVTDG